MTNCEKCGFNTLESVRLSTYRAVRLGIDAEVIVLDGADQLRCGSCDEVAATIVLNLAGLIAAVAVTRCKDEKKLSGNDVRFLRKALDWSGKDLAERLEVTTTTVSNWETQKTPIRPADEKLLRIWVGLRLGPQAPLIHFEPGMIESLKITWAAADEPTVMCFQAIRRDKAKTWAEVDRAA